MSGGVKGEGRYGRSLRSIGATVAGLALVLTGGLLGVAPAPANAIPTEPMHAAADHAEWDWVAGGAGKGAADAGAADAGGAGKGAADAGAAGEDAQPEGPAAEVPAADGPEGEAGSEGETTSEGGDPQGGDPEAGDLAVAEPEGEGSPVAEAPADIATFPAGAYSAQPLQAGMLRLSGPDRYSTSAKVAARVTNVSGKSETVFVASGSSYADGLAIGALAAYTGSPVLLVNKGTVPTATAAQLSTLDPQRIVVAGGPGAVSDAALGALGRLAPRAKVERIGGSDRYATAALIAQRFPKDSPVFLATGLDFPDALAAGAAASKLGGPILLTPGFRTSSALNSSLTDLQPDSVYIVGGRWSQGDLASIRGAAGVPEITQISGVDRYATSAEVARQFWGTGATTTVYATGKDYADAMVGVSAARAFDAPILLSSGGCRPLSVGQVAANQKQIVVLGGTGVMSDRSYNTACITPSKQKASPTFNNGTYSFNIGWVGQQTNYWCGSASAYMVLNRLGWATSVRGHGLSQGNLASNSYMEVERNGRTLWPGNYMGRGIQRWTGISLYSQHPSPSAADLRKRVSDSFLVTGRPVMVHETVKPGRPMINNQTGRDFTHVMVVNAYNPVADTLTILDPGAVVVWPYAAPSFTIKVADMAGYLGELGLYY